MGGRYSVNPVTLSKLHGVRVQGAGVDTSIFCRARLRSRMSCWSTISAMIGALTASAFSAAILLKGSRPMAGIISEMTQFRIDHIAVHKCGIGFWFLRGGYGSVEQMDIFGGSGSYFKTGGNADGVQAAEFLVKNVLVDGHYCGQGGPAPTATNYEAVAAFTTGVGLDIDSRSAYIKFDHITGAGTAYGVLIHDSEGGDKWDARSMRPEGIYFRDINFDWGRQCATADRFPPASWTSIWPGCVPSGQPPRWCRISPICICAIAMPVPRMAKVCASRGVSVN